MVDVRAVVASWFVMLQEDIYVLIRIESLVALVTMMFLAMFIMDIFRYQNHSSTITTIIETVDGLSNHIVVYLLGAMQSAGFKNPLFPVWAVVLVSLRGSLGYLSGFGFMDRNRQVTEFAGVIQLMTAGVLNGTRALEFTKPLWSLWAILTLRSLYRIFAQHMAAESLWHGRSSEFLPEYLQKSVTEGNQHGRSNDLGNSDNYLVYGESKQKISIQRPQYSLQFQVTDPDSLITLGKIRSECSGPLLSFSSSSIYKDMSVAFSLSSLLRCRLEDVQLNSVSISRTRGLIISDIIGDPCVDREVEPARVARVVRAFKILELELAFVRDYFYTLYPVVFWKGLCSLSLSILQSIATFSVALWLAVDIREVKKLPQKKANAQELLKDNRIVALQVGGQNVDVIITWMFMFFMMFKEVWEMVTYLLSNWTRLLLVCKYGQNQCFRIMKTGFIEDLISSFFASNIADPWHGRMDQYEFLQSCTYKPTLWKMAHIATLGKTPKKFDGKQTGDAIKIPQCVKEAVLKELRLELTGPQLCTGIPILTHPQIRFERYKWAWFNLSKCSQSILVWHIATSLCEIKLAQDKDIDLSKSSFLHSVWSFLKKWVCCSSQPFLIYENTSLEGQLQTNYRIANSLSRYCAYLLVFWSELLPDSFIVPDMIFDKTLEYACEKLDDCDSKRCRYNTLMALGQEAMQDSEDGRLNRNIVEQGAMLANDLINENEQDRWEILAGVWTKLFVHIAPSCNAEAHKRSLKSGGELITLIWALLWHCGIEKSNMWNEDRTSESNAQTPQENNTETRNTQIIEEKDNEKGPETSTFRRGRRSKNGHTDTEDQAPMDNGARNIMPPSRTTN
ncbi:hypothetical protein ACP70R_008836 [Stipagrostis hirtigluma subsp. patula]